MQTNQGPQWLLIGSGDALLLWGGWQLRTAWRGRTAATGSVRGPRIINAAMALVLFSCGAMTLIVGIDPTQGQIASNTALAFLFLAALAFIVGVVVRARERFEDRRIRRELGLSTKRRRWHPLLVGFLVYMGLSMAGMAIMVAVMTARFQPGDQVNQNLIVAIMAGAFIAGVAAAGVQAWRRTVRDREIQNSGRDLAGMPVLARPRTPLRVGVDTGNDLVAGWRRPCPPEKVIEVITICVAMTLIGGLVAVTFLAQAIAPGVPPQDAAIAALIGVATLGAIVWGTSVVPPGGLVDAIRHVIRSPGLGGKE